MINRGNLLEHAGVACPTGVAQIRSIVWERRVASALYEVRMFRENTRDFELNLFVEVIRIAVVNAHLFEYMHVDDTIPEIFAVLTRDVYVL